MRPLVALSLLFFGGCTPATILSSRTIKEEPARVYPQMSAALQSQYQCSDATDETSFLAQCKSERGGVSVEIKRKTERPVLSLHFWIGHDGCGTPELMIRLEQFVLQDASGGTRAYCSENKLVLAFDSYLPATGIEPAELASFVVAWEKDAVNTAARFGLLPEVEKKS